MTLSSTEKTKPEEKTSLTIKNSIEMVKSDDNTTAFNLKDSTGTLGLDDTTTTVNLEDTTTTVNLDDTTATVDSEITIRTEVLELTSTTKTKKNAESTFDAKTPPKFPVEKDGDSSYEPKMPSLSSVVHNLLHTDVEGCQRDVDMTLSSTEKTKPEEKTSLAKKNSIEMVKSDDNTTAFNLKDSTGTLGLDDTTTTVNLEDTTTTVNLDDTTATVDSENTIRTEVLELTSTMKTKKNAESKFDAKTPPKFPVEKDGDGENYLFGKPGQYALIGRLVGLLSLVLAFILAPCRNRSTQHDTRSIDGTFTVPSLD
ncbi:TNF receptor-associated factor family protein DDB_G0272098-like [Ptychodera flava]|uniref:TNF receptor-associated factor family protein DDB_G0272098-like n=1 Tax=Ptychodera flava TaxID=63121 RepID=UPI00396A1A1C